MTKRPLTGFNFTVSLLPSPDSGNGAAVGEVVLSTAGIRATAGFAEASGLEMRMGVEDYQAGGLNGGTLKFIGPVSWPDIVLRRGLIERRDPFDKSDLWAWCQEFLDGAGKRRDGVITINDQAGEARRAFAFRRGIPVQWTGPSLDAGQSLVAMESIQIAHEGLTDITGGASIGNVIGEAVDFVTDSIF